MHIADFLTAGRVLLDLRVRNKPALIQQIAALFQRDDPSLDAAAIEAALLARENLGSTGLGDGFALPHARIETLTAPRGLFLRLARPLAFEAIDGQPVDLAFALLLPGADPATQLGALAAVSRSFRDPALRTQLRQAGSATEVFALLTAR
jgi:PTS system nitrogen regulatory IIA component